jgi:hypothetical protein
VLAERSFDTGSVPINYADGGGTGPLLVLLHGVNTR